MRLRSFAFVVLLFYTQLAGAAIFGKDDRTSITPGSPAYELSRSTAVAVLSSNVSINPKGLLDLSVERLSDELCKDEKFANDPSLSYACTGFLVGPDLLVTAGHCQVNTGQSKHESESYCEAFSWLFGYETGANGETQVTDIDPENLYACKQIIYAVREEQSPYRDFALVRLARPVQGRQPFTLSNANMNIGVSVTMIGYPLGMPAKYSSQGRVILNSSAHQSFITNLDALDGNSGSPVFNDKKEVVGILVGGTPVEILKKDVKNSCSRYNVCDDNGKNCDVPDADPSKIPEFQVTGSIVQHIGPVMDLIHHIEVMSQFVFASADISQ